jgi:hypothetical protein
MPDLWLHVADDVSEVHVSSPRGRAEMTRWNGVSHCIQNARDMENCKMMLEKRQAPSSDAGMPRR